MFSSWTTEEPLTNKIAENTTSQEPNRGHIAQIVGDIVRFVSDRLTGFDDFFRLFSDFEEFYNENDAEH